MNVASSSIKNNVIVTEPFVFVRKISLLYEVVTRMRKKKKNPSHNT